MGRRGQIVFGATIAVVLLYFALAPVLAISIPDSVSKPWGKIFFAPAIWLDSAAAPYEDYCRWLFEM